MKSLYAVLSMLELVLTCNDTQVFSCASKRLSHFHMLNSLCTVPVGLVVKVSPSWHQAVKPEPGSPAPELWVKPGCQADPHSFYLQTKFKGWVQVHTSPGFSAMSFALAQEAAIDWQRIAPLQ